MVYSAQPDNTKDRRRPAMEAARKGRWAIGAFFLLNGFITGSWAVQIPQLFPRFGITEKTVGSLIVVFGLGMVLMMPLSGLVMAKLGSQRVTRIFAIATAFGLIPIVIAPNVPVLTITVFILGAVIGGIDVSMNSNVVAVERALSRAVISSSHALWSVGVFIAGSIGGWAINSFGFFLHVILVTAIAALVVAVAYPHVLKDDPAPKLGSKQPMRLPRSPVIYLIGIVALFGMIPERAVVDWSAIYLLQMPGGDVETAGLAFAFFAGAMAILRFIGDTVRNRLGAVRTLRISSIIASAGFLVGAFATTPWLAICGFAFSGIGIANIVPIAFSAAGNQKGIVSSTGMSIVTSMGYSGTLAAPALIGVTVESIGFANVFMMLAVMLFAIFLLAPLMRGEDLKRESQKIGR